MAETATINIRIDPEVNMSLPRYNAETLAAMQEARAVQLKLLAARSKPTEVARLIMTEEAERASAVVVELTAYLPVLQAVSK